MVETADHLRSTTSTPDGELFNAQRITPGHQHMRDIVETIGRSTVHHGPFSDRLYLMALDRGDFPGVISRMECLARMRRYGKVLARVPEDIGEAFMAAGYVCEASVPGFFGPALRGMFVSKFLSADRRAERHPNQLRRSMALLESVAPGSLPFDGEAAVPVDGWQPQDAPEMSRVYRAVFESYPFPVDDPDYLKDTMDDHSAYFCIRHRERIVAVASAEIDPRHRNAEMTDFAVLPGWRNRRLASRLLIAMEAEMRRRGIRVAYTIARALSPAVNVVFKRMGYRFSGILTNNTQIGGRIETMAVWHKPLMRRPATWTSRAEDR